MLQRAVLATDSDSSHVTPDGVQLGNDFKLALAQALYFLSFSQV